MQILDYEKTPPRRPVDAEIDSGALLRACISHALAWWIGGLMWSIALLVLI